MPIKTMYIFLMILVISITMATGYSLFSTELTINGAVTLTPELEIEVPSQGTDENGVDRFTANPTVENLLGMELLRVVDEQAVGNSITTTMQVVSTLSFFGSSLEINLEIKNGSKNTFTNGTITLLESSDTGGALTSRTQTISAATVEPGAITTATVGGTVRVGNIEAGTYYKYRILFDTSEGEKVFYYTLKLEPQA